jgi:hypothetical protein
MPIPRPDRYAIEVPPDLAFGKLLVALKSVGFEIDSSEPVTRALTAVRSEAMIGLSARVDESEKYGSILLIDVVELDDALGEGGPVPWEKPDLEVEPWITEIIAELSSLLAVTTPYRIDGA